MFGRISVRNALGGFRRSRSAEDAGFALNRPCYPAGATADNFGEWVISASAVRGDWNHAAWTAFDALAPAYDTAPGWAGPNGVGWMQWRNTARRVTIGRYSLVGRYLGTGGYGTSAWTLQGSDDGATWTDLDSGSAAGSSRVERVVAAPAAYYYHRINITAVETLPYLHLIQAWRR